MANFAILFLCKTLRDEEMEQTTMANRFTNLGVLLSQPFLLLLQSSQTRFRSLIQSNKSVPYQANTLYIWQMDVREEDGQSQNCES